MKDLISLASQARDIFAKEPTLIKLDNPRILIVGDTHGDVESSKNAIKIADENGAAVVFLGDYVDRGPYQIENITFLFEIKITEPRRIFLLRGNHESLTMNTHYGFLDLMSRRHGLKTYRAFLEAFTQMPYALLWREVFCVHGGIARDLESVEQVEKIRRGEDDPEDEIGFQLLWNDPRENVRGFVESWRGGGALFFGEDVFQRFMERNGLRLLIRSHEPMPSGYRYIFAGKLLTVFSCRHYSVPPVAALLDIHKKDPEIMGLG